MTLRTRCYPRDDPVFAARVEQLAVGIDKDGDRHSLAFAVAAVVAQLRGDYPLCRLVVQDGLATLGGEIVLYAYRDGHALSVGHDGPGATRHRRRTEIALRRSADLLVSSEALLVMAVEVAAATADAHARFRSSHPPV